MPARIADRIIEAIWRVRDEISKLSYLGLVDTEEACQIAIAPTKEVWGN
jgi:hypothetical protein